MRPVDAPLANKAVNLRKRAAKGVFWTAASNWGNELTRLLLFMVLARLLTPEQFGLVALALVFIMLTQVVAEQGMADALVQRRRLDPEHLDSAFWMSVAVGLVLAALLAGLAVPIALLLGQADLAPVLAALAVAMPIGSLSLVQRAVLMRRMAFRSLALRTLISIAVGAACALAAALLGFGVWSLVVQHTVTPLVGMLVLWRVSDWRPRLRFSYAHFRDLFAFGVNVVGSRLLLTFSRRSDELFIGGFLGAASLGIYTVAYRMVRLLIQLTSSLVDQVAFPLYSRLQDEPTRRARAYYKTTSFAALLAFPAFTATLVMAPEFLTVLFGPQWEASVPIVQILSVLGVIQLLSQLNATLLRAAGKPAWQLAIIALTTMLKVAAFFIAVNYGLVAVAIAAACVGLLTAPAWYWAVHRLVPITAGGYLQTVKGPLLASAVAAAVMLALREALGESHVALTLIAALCAGGVAYVATVRLFARSLVDEALELARSALPRFPSPRRTKPVSAESAGSYR